MRRYLATGLIALGIVSLPGSARADDVASADTLFEEANALVAAGRYADACPKLAQSQKLEPAVGTQFNLADCYEHLGRTATAFLLFTEVAHIARAAGKFEREHFAKARASSLEPRLARMRIVTKATAPGLEITIDDAAVPRDRWTTVFPIDPGEHHVVASAPSRLSWQGSTKALEGRTIDLVVPELIDPSPRRAEPRTPSSTQRTLAIVTAGVGVVGTAVGAVAGALSLSAGARAEEACPSARYHFRCPTTSGSDDWNSATTAGNVSTVGFIVGGVALAGAAVLWFTAPSAKTRAGVTPTGFRFERTF